MALKEYYLYPPKVDTYTPSFIGESNYNSVCRIDFFDDMNQTTDIKNIQVSIRDQSTNQSVLNTNLYPCEIMITQLKIEGSQLYIELKGTDLQDGFQLNQSYKVQLRYTHIQAEDPSLNFVTNPDGSVTQAISTWLVQNYRYFSEWSSVTLIKRISRIDWSFPSLVHIGGDFPGLSILNPILIGKMSFIESEGVDSLIKYKIDLYEENDPHKKLQTGEWQFLDPQVEHFGFNYEFHFPFNNGKLYKAKIYYMTKNLYEGIEEKSFMGIQKASQLNDFFILKASIDERQGFANLEFKKKTTSKGTFSMKSITIRRASSKDNFLAFQTLKKHQFYYASKIKSFSWTDKTLESGILYQYIIEIENEDGALTYLKLKNPIGVFLEDVLIYDGERQLTLKFNPEISSFKRVIKENITETLGSKHPFIRRGAYTNYAQFPIGGLISMYMDSTFDEDQRKLINPQEQEFNENKINEYYNFDFSDIQKEKFFRDQVIQFLYKDSIKLFRSATEGTFLIKITDVSLTPNQTLGRNIWSFSGTATEIDDFSVENCKKYNLFEEGVFEDDVY